MCSFNAKMSFKQNVNLDRKLLVIDPIYWQKSQSRKTEYCIKDMNHILRPVVKRWVGMHSLTDKIVCKLYLS